MADNENFLWGVASSAHQVERSSDNEWVRNDKHIRENSGGYSLIKSLFFRGLWKSNRIGDQMREKNAYSQTANKISHEKNYREDYEIAKDIGINSARFSISWAKVEPKKGTFDEEALQYYEEMITYLTDNNIQPVVTLWHFTHPSWFFENGGWANKNSSKLFKRFVKKVVDRIGDKVDFWITLNEPVGWIRSSYIFDNFPPRNTLRRNTIKAFRSMSEAHNSAYKTIKKASEGKCKVGISATSGCFEAYGNNMLNKTIAKILRYVERDAFLDKCEDNLDYIGVNNYYHCKVDVLFRNQLSSIPRSDLNWPLSPSGVAKVCEQMHERYKLPIIVTEHGLADYRDKDRGWYIDKSLRELQRKQKEGIPINGYFHWSLIDNIEWDSGRWPRFGLIEMDYRTGERRLRESSEDYRKCIEGLSMSSEW